MKNSPFQIILMVVFGFAAVIGLFVFATYKGSSKATTAGSVIIWGTLPAAGMTATLTALTPTDPDLKDVSYVKKDPATIATDLAAAIATGNAPDLVLASQEELKSLSRFIQPIATTVLPAATFQKTFPQEAGLFAVTGGYMGIPFLIDPLVLFSNRTILASDSIARPPATWEALTGLVPSVAVLSPSRQISRALIALGTYDNVTSARGILSTLFLQTGVPVSGVSPAGSLVGNLGTTAQTGGVSPGNSVLGFYTQFSDPTKVSYTWNASLPSSEQTFLSGDLALYIGYVSRARYLRTANPNLDFIVSAVPQPATATDNAVYGLMYTFMIPNGAKNPSGALMVASLFSNANEQGVAASNTGLAPATLNQLSSPPTTDPIAAVAYKEALYASGWLSPLSVSTDQVFSGMIANVTSGRSSIDNALLYAEQSLTALLQQ